MLKSLEQHDADIFALYQQTKGYDKKNGIECPKCGEELIDSNPETTLMSYPPQKEIQCLKCDFKGTRYC